MGNSVGTTYSGVDGRLKQPAVGIDLGIGLGMAYSRGDVRLERTAVGSGGHESAGGGAIGLPALSAALRDMVAAMPKVRAAWEPYNAIQVYVQHDAQAEEGFKGDFDRILRASKSQ